MIVFRVEQGGSGTLEPPPPLRPDAGATALFLDLDGTLAPFEARPELVGVDPSRNRLLRILSGRLDGRLAIVSGRPLADIDRILEGAVGPAAGVHGLERRRPCGVTEIHPPHPALDSVAETLAAFARTAPGVLIERKTQSVALHYRAAPAAGGAVLEICERLARDSGLHLQLGSMVAELRTPGADKGDALRAFMAEAPFKGSTPLAVGDDLTDEAAFEAAKALGGAGILVGAPRPSAARFNLKDVDAVLAWLQAAASSPESGDRKAADPCLAW